MAAVEPLGSADALDATQWLVVRGTLRESDLAPLLERTSGAERCDVTLDLLNLDHLTPGGCWTIRNLADDLWRRGCLLTVLVRAGGVAAEALRSSGTAAHPRVVVQGSSFD